MSQPASDPRTVLPPGIVNLADHETHAATHLEPGAWAYFNGAAADEITLAANRHAWDRMGLLPRVLRPLARTVTVVRAGDGQRVELTHEHDGVFAGVAPTPRVAGAAAGDYRVEVAYETEDGTTGPVQEQDDAYRHLPTLGELDLHLIGEGRHERLWEVLGARVVRTSADEAVGTAFAVWAPNARAP